MERILVGEEGIKYDHLFNARDPDNKTFWMNPLSLADYLAWGGIKCVKFL
jgi:hypothetical protein